MDSPVNIICLISNFSPASNRFITKANECGVDFIKYISIDDAQLRNLIKDRVRRVPYLIINYSSGNVEVYEGDKSFDWLNEIINNKLRQEIDVKNQKEQKYLQEIESLKRKQVELQQKMQDEQKLLEEKLKAASSQPASVALSVPSSQASGNRFTSIADLGGDVAETDDAAQQKMVSAATKKSSSLLERAKELEKGREELSNKKQL